MITYKYMHDAKHSDKWAFYKDGVHIGWLDCYGGGFIGDGPFEDNCEWDESLHEQCWDMIKDIVEEE